MVQTQNTHSANSLHTATAVISSRPDAAASESPRRAAGAGAELIKFYAWFAYCCAEDLHRWHEVFTSDADAKELKIKKKFTRLVTSLRGYRTIKKVNSRGNSHGLHCCKKEFALQHRGYRAKKKGHLKK
jgi:hypothetical protein